MLSYWEHKHFTQYDYLVIGGGIVGISTALELRARKPNAAIAILERGLFPSGASTKNAGFACFGSVSEIIADIKSMGPEASRQLVQQRWQGLQILRERLGDDHLDFKAFGGYEVLTEREMHLIDEIAEVNKLLYPVFDQDVFQDQSGELGSLGLNDQMVKGLIYNPLEAQIDSGAMMNALWRAAAVQGISLFTGAEVVQFDEQVTGVLVEVNQMGQTIELQANQIAICANAFARRFLPDLPLAPGRGQVLVTTPISNLKLKGVFHYQEGYYYFRNIDGRVMLGGGRNLDLETEETTEPGINPQISAHLHQMLKEVILPDHTFDIEYQWSGIMAFGADKRPLVKLHSDQVGYAVRLGGMGVALGSLLGSQMAHLLCLKT